MTEVWEAATTLPGYDEAGPARWYHGDLLAENLLVRDGRLAAVLDFGALAVGDPTADLVGAWEILDAPARAVMRARLGVDDATWLRGRAWALVIAVMTFPYYWRTMPERCVSRLAIRPHGTRRPHGLIRTRSGCAGVLRTLVRDETNFATIVFRGLRALVTALSTPMGQSEIWPLPSAP